MSGNTTKQEWTAPILVLQSRVVVSTLGTPGLVGEPLAGFFFKTGV